MADKDSPACPVDSQTRDAWLAQARAAAAAESNTPSCPVNHDSSPTNPPKTWTQSLTSYLPWSSASPTSSPKPPTRAPTGLDTSRVVSTIPRSTPATATATATTTTTTTTSPCPANESATPASDPPTVAANHEIESGVDPSGKWVYPSEKMFFEAMKRKGYDARVADMKTVVPIHNAVNERAWREIVEWEEPYLAGTSCKTPKLESFANKNDRMTPTARFNTLLGYTAPFDRHDWVIDRCGTRIDYVIDFYAGRPDPAGKAGPSFYLHVRPKLNTWEGVKMRAWRLTGLA